MKILALRIRNLASLAGEVVVDFEAAPLAQAGLFAITGPTGAGKSTLLDALCLALYDRLPRLDQASRTEIGRTDGTEERIAGDDVRTILRHGAADGFAEVDFVGRDGGRYRAKWKVARARGKANGRLQAQVMALTDMATGRILGGGKRETLDAIRDKAGLDYGQFRRSVLLAQNEFDAFLRAKPAERAELLELMTGTEIYGELSVAAHERCRQERTALDLLDQELARVNVLADDQRAVVEAEAALAEDDFTRLEAEIGALLRETEWYRKAAELSDRLGAARSQLDQARQAQAEAQPQRLRLAETRRAMSAAPLVAEADRLAAERERLAKDEHLARQDLAGRKAERESRHAARDTAKLAEDQAEAAFKAAGPVLDRATELDAQILDRQTRLQASNGELVQAQALALQARAMLDQAQAQHGGSAAKIAKIEDWLLQHQGRKMLSEQLDRWLEAISAHGRAAAEKKRAEQAVGVPTASRAEIQAALVEAEQAIVALTGQLAGEDVEVLEQRRTELSALDSRLDALEAEARAARSLCERNDELAERRLQAEKRRHNAEGALGLMDADRARLDAILPEARRALDLASAAEGKEAALLRERLMSGEPCPVCGSPDHPLGNVQIVLTDLLVAHRRRVAELEGEGEALSRRRADEKANVLAAEEALKLVAADAVRLDADMAALQRRWTDLRAATALDLAPDPFAGMESKAVQEARSRCKSELEGLLADLRRIRQAQAELRGLCDRRDRLRGEAQARADGERQAAEMARLAEQLAAPLAVVADWRQRLEENAEALAETCRKLAEDWRRGGLSLDSERDNERKLASKRDSAQAALANATHNVHRAAALLADEQAAFDRLRQARADLFEGRPTGDVRSAFNTACKARKAEYQQAQDLWAAADRAHGIAEESVRVLGLALTAANTALHQAVAARESRLAEIGLDLAAVQAASALGEAWVMVEAARQESLRDAETMAGAVFNERDAALQSHMEAGRPLRPEAELAAMLPERAILRDTARDRLSDLRNRLAEDDRNRDAAGQTRERIAGQRQRHDLWKGMADLIGSADGKKFRLFAQGLTLDRLLHLANAHLAELTPRYALQRAPGGDLDLQVVDGDMADEVRGVASLSGGERFLVSLSLALGLASMTGSRVIAESLFIDEGFGALDAESLDVAISALETLHASGRKVGVISHVQPMIDRIGVQIRVAKLGGGRSAIETRAA